jgi:dipeptidase
MYFGKNSDRDPDEVQNLITVPAQNYSTGSKLKCTYIEIPQVTHTNEIFLSKPYWIWGAEIGVNEFGVCIGNEAFFTRIPPKKENKYLLGMDLLRLGLERANTAKDALGVIISLLEQYGQGGNCGHNHNFYYNNGFIIADGKEAYVLETIDKMWVWKRITTFWSMSNGISLTTDFDTTSPDLIPFAIRKKWCKSASDFNVKKCFSAGFMTKMANAANRRACTWNCLLQCQSNIGLSDVISTLRNHGEFDKNPKWTPMISKKLTVCAHAAGLTSPSQSTGSMAVWVAPNGKFSTLATGSSNPCLSTFKFAYAPGLQLPPTYHEGKIPADLDAYWWQAEKFNRIGLLHYHEFLAELDPHRKLIEKSILEKIQTNQANQSLIDSSFQQSLELMEKMVQNYKNIPPESLTAKVQKYWKKIDQKTGLR